MVPERGFVPLGIGLGGNTNPVDQRLDLQQSLTTSGLVQARLAPPHHGLEGSPYVISMWARSPRPTPPPAGGQVTAGVVTRLPAGPTFDPSGFAPIELPPFARIPTAPVWLSATRSFSFAGTTFTNETVVIVTFVAPGGARWSVATLPQAPSFRLPAAPSPFADRTASPRLHVEPLRLAADQMNGAPVTFSQLVEHDDVDLDDLLTTTVAFSGFDP